MNKILLNTYLNDLFKYGLENKVSPDKYFSILLKNEEFINLVNMKPFDVNELKKIILLSSKTKILPNENKIEYLSFLMTSFLDQTDIPINKLNQYIDIKYIFDNFIRLHTLDENDVIMELMIRRNEKYIIFNLDFDVEDFITSLPYNLKIIFPYKRFDTFELVYDRGVKAYFFYTKTGETLIYEKDINHIIVDNRFKNKYLSGNCVYQFSELNNEVSIKDIDFSLYQFIYSNENITLIEPNGLKHKFKIKINK